LGRFEAEHWGPIVSRLNTHFGIKLHINKGGFEVLPQEPRTYDTLRIYLNNLSCWELAAAERIMHDMKSVMLGVAYMTGFVDVESAIKAASLELLWQSQRWGLVEDVHSVELARLRQNLLLASLFKAQSKSLGANIDLPSELH
jgi:ATP synthase mitochondrial F1 complex assembly factor 2